MRLLITGAKGQLGHALVGQGGGHALMDVCHEQLDITDQDAVLRCCDTFHPDIVINAAAYTAVDRVESDVEKAFAVNRDGPANLARACRQGGIPLIHVSTDYVFDGTKAGPYVEEDPTAPLGVYGASKLAGEHAVQQYASTWTILRTSWVFSAHGNNFVKTMLRLGAERPELGVVSDQYGCPTSANELARAIYAVCDSGLADQRRVYHCCQPEPTTWFDFATAIFAEAQRQGLVLNMPHVNAIPTSDYPTPVKRPANSVMDCSKFKQTFDFHIRPWRDSLAETMREIMNSIHARNKQ